MSDRFDEMADKVTTTYLLGEGMSIGELDRDIAQLLRQVHNDAIEAAAKLYDCRCDHPRCTRTEDAAKLRALKVQP